MKAKVVLLDRIVEDFTPEYRLYGKVLCTTCSEWCHLGSATFAAVAARTAVPMCLQCAERLIPKDSEAVKITHLQDHSMKGWMS